MNDLRFAVRQIWRRPAFAVMATLTLALGIGASTAIFSVVDATLLRPLPYEEQGRILDVFSVWSGTPKAQISPAEYFDYRESVGPIFSSLGVYAMGSANLTGVGEPVRLRAGYASAELLTALGVSPEVGRTFSAEEEAAHRDLALISHALWVRQFGKDRGVVGRDVVLDGAKTRIIGILPSGFRLPADFSAGRQTDVLMPLGLDAADVVARGSHFLLAAARLSPGVTHRQAQAALSAIASRFVARFPDDYPSEMRFGVHTTPIVEAVIGDVRLPLYLLLGGAGLVLLIACANVASLMLVRVDSRREELAIRAAIGARRRRIVRQLLVEGVAVGGLGGLLGVGLAAGGIRFLLTLSPPGLPRFAEISIDLTVLAFAAGVTLGTTLLFGLVPALRGSRVGLATVLRREGRAATGGHQRVRRALVGGQIAVALALLVGAGLLARSLVALTSVDPGFRRDHLLTARVSLPAADYPTEAKVVDTFDTIRQRISAQPGVLAVGGVSNLPLASTLGDLNVHIEGREVPAGAVSPRADWQVVTPGYFKAMGLTLRRGRMLDERDRDGAPGAVVINETMARRYWPGDDPLGARFVLGGGAGPGEVTVVGIVGDVRHSSLSATRTSQMYLAHAQFRYWNGGSVVRQLSYVVHSAGNPAALVEGLRRAVHGVDPRLPLADVRTMEHVVSSSLSRQRFLCALAIVFTAVAVALGAFGIFGVIAYSVSRRTRELGLRVALGAQRRQLLASVLLEGSRLVVAGVAVGLAGGIGVAQLLRGQLFGVVPLDPLTLVAAPAALSIVALLAMWIPARRAARIDPMEALRHE
jgi:putative ABC transport system permease protein